MILDGVPNLKNDVYLKTQYYENPFSYAPPISVDVTLPDGMPLCFTWYEDGSEKWFAYRPLPSGDTEYHEVNLTKVFQIIEPGKVAALLAEHDSAVKAWRRKVDGVKKLLESAGGL